MRFRIHGTLRRSRANGPGTRAVVWFQGCTLRCPGCFNPDAQSPEGGQLADTAALAGWVAELSGIEGVTFSGGEPFQQPEALLDLTRRIRPTGLSIIVFTGHTLEELNALPQCAAIFEYVDTLIAGRYDATQHCAQGLLASSNQRIHHLTPRHSAIDFTSLPSREAIIQPDGSIVLTGVNPPPASSIRQ